METIDKPRLNYAAIFSKPAAPIYQKDTVAWLIQKLIEEMAQPGGRQYCRSHGYTLKTLQRSSLALKGHTALKVLDFIDYCKARRAAGVMPQTIMKDMVALSGVLKHAVEVWEMSDAGSLAYQKAKPQLIRQQLISKSQARDRRPTEEELTKLRAFFDKQATHPSTRLPMRDLMDFQLASGRRIGETCRLLWSDLDEAKRICLVRDLKNPKGKGFHDFFPLLGDAWTIVQRQPRTCDRIFPYSAKSVGASYTRAKNALEIKNLRLHDNRRECISRLFEAGYSVPEVAKVSLHRNPTQLLGTYTKLRAEDLHRGPAAKRELALAA